MTWPWDRGNQHDTDITTRFIAVASHHFQFALEVSILKLPPRSHWIQLPSRLDTLTFKLTFKLTLKLSLTLLCTKEFATSPHSICSLCSLYERGLQYVGTDWNCYILWDKYIEYELSRSEWGRAAELYSRLLQMPSATLDKSWEK